MALQTRHGQYGLRTGIDSTQLTRTSRMVSNYTGIAVPPNKAIVGANAFAHEAGIHQDGMLKDERTYEIMTPSTVGLAESKLVLGKHSGRHAFRLRMAELGFELSSGDLYPAFQRFKLLAEKKKVVTDADLQALATSEVTSWRSSSRWSICRLRVANPVCRQQQYVCEGPRGWRRPWAPVRWMLRFRPSTRCFDRPLLWLNTASTALPRVSMPREVSVRIRSADGDPRTFGGYSADTDVIMASAQAYLSALNRLLVAQGQGSTGRETGSATVSVAR